MPTNNYSATNSDGVQYALVYNAASLSNLIANYTLTITPPAGGTPITIDDVPPGNVLTSNGTMNIASAVAGSTFVIPPGVTGTLNILVALATLTPNTVYVGGNATIASAVSALGNLVVDVNGGTATAATNTVLGALSGMTVNLTNGGTFSNGSALIGALDGTTIDFGPTGGTFVANAGDAVVDLSQTTINGFSAAVDKIEFDNLPTALDHYSITDGASSQTIALFNNTGSQIASVAIAGNSLRAGVVDLGQSGPLTIVPNANGTSITIDPVASILTCFLAGTRILTPFGEAAIETLQAGDLVLTADGRRVPIAWVHVNLISTLFANPTDIMPIRIQAGALADNIPSRDLYVSPDHSMYLGGVLVPAQLLLDGATITQIQCAGSIPYYHLELEPHDLIVAEGAATESYLNIGNRRHSPRPGVISALPVPDPKTWDDACAPLVLSGAKLRQIRARLAHRRGIVQVATQDDDPGSAQRSGPNVKTRADNGVGVGWAEPMRLLGADMSLLSQSTLFDENHYLINYPDVRTSKMSPLEHFCRYGHSENRRPNPYFDTKWYREKYLSGLDSRVNPLAFYVRYGSVSLHRPIIYFDPEWYVEEYDVPQDVLPLAHYLQFRSRQTYSPNKLFDVAFYMASNGDVVGKNRDPFLHYLRIGVTHDVRPSASFDPASYRDGRAYPGPSNPVAGAEVHERLRRERLNPLIHFLLQNEKQEERERRFCFPHQGSTAPASHSAGGSARPVPG